MQLINVNNETMALQNSQGPKIKLERPDEHEINQLAIEMAEKNRQKMLTRAAEIRQQNQVSQQALQRAGGQQMITFYFRKDNKDYSSSDSLLPKKIEEKKKGLIDEESLKGRFGWTTIHNVYIPYIFRHDDKYCAVRMIESKLLNKYLNYLPHEITTCIHVRSYYITEGESKLFNEINLKHCECQFGREVFTIKDLVVRVADAKCFYKFLDTCYKKLVQKSPEQSEYCGFVRINGESVVPYTVKASVKYVPLFYFEGETDTLKLKAEKIEGWELAYLKFCCKVQGIRNELFASDTCAVVSLDDVKQYFPKDTQFEDWWPQKTAEPIRIHSQGTKPGGNWTQRPPAPVTTSTQNTQSTTSVTTTAPTSSSRAPVIPHNTAPPVQHKNNSTHQTSMAGMTPLNTNNYNSLYSQWAAAASLMNGQAQAQAQVFAAYANYPGMQNFMSQMSPDHMRRAGSTLPGSATSLMPTLSAESHRTLRPPPLVRTSNSGSVTSQTYSSSPSRVPNTNLEALRQLGYLPDQGSSNPMDAILGSTRHQTPNSIVHNVVLNINNNTKIQNQPKVPPPLIPVSSNGLRTDNFSSHRGVGRNGIDKLKLIDIPSFRPDPAGRIGQPYKVRKIIIEGKPIYCINHTSFSFNEQNMVAVQDILREVAPGASLSECVEVFMNVLQVPVYKANWNQVCSLMEAWSKSHVQDQAVPTDIVPLIKSSDLIKYITQIKYIFEKQQQSLGHQQAKRLKT